MKYLILISFLILIGCKKEDETPTPDPITETEMYFPPTDSDDWSSKSPENLNWNIDELENLYDFLEDGQTRAFIILKNGEIVVEKYWGNNIFDTQPFDQNTQWYWASAGKTLTATLTGIAQEEGLLNIDDKSSDYLGSNWSSLPLEKENLITVKHHITMTTGLDYNVTNQNCTEPSCLTYLADAGTQWYYHNAAYTLTQNIITNATGMSYDDYTNQAIESHIGMSGTWFPLDDLVIYWSTARDAARFGLLLLNEGHWGQTPVLNDPDFFHDMTNTSQDLNKSYGYLTWLNGKSSIIFPGLPNSFPFPLSENAPDDCYAAMGKNGQYIDMIPSKGLVIIRMGQAPDESFVPTAFHDEIWQKINAVIP
ncbi:MAG: CubicO group peptidase (beta-lactamase class C family) [Patiriisocius sp.]|jgi:CubicO group peptidase (beta-lactamase class C family)